MILMVPRLINGKMRLRCASSHITGSLCLTYFVVEMTEHELGINRPGSTTLTFVLVQGGRKLGAVHSREIPHGDEIIPAVDQAQVCTATATTAERLATWTSIPSTEKPDQDNLSRLHCLSAFPPLLVFLAILIFRLSVVLSSALLRSSPIRERFVIRLL
jgi:hypothetical protein